MKITARTIRDIRILDCSGKITLDGGVQSIRSTVHDSLQSGANKIVLNLGHIKFIDRTGVCELIDAYDFVTHDGGQVRLLNVTKNISDPLVITQLLAVYKSFNDENAAIASFEWCPVEVQQSAEDDLIYVVEKGNHASSRYPPNMPAI